jgi:hypothetical protein
MFAGKVNVIRIQFAVEERGKVLVFFKKLLLN